MQKNILKYVYFLFKDKEPRGIIPLENLSIREVDDSKKPVNSLSLSGTEMQENCTNTFYAFFKKVPYSFILDSSVATLHD